VEIDPATGNTILSAMVGEYPTAVAVGASSVWVVNGNDRAHPPFARDAGTIDIIDAHTAHVTHVVSLGVFPTEAAAVAVDGDSLWAAVTDNVVNRLLRV